MRCSDIPKPRSHSAVTAGVVRSNQRQRPQCGVKLFFWFSIPTLPTSIKKPSTTSSFPTSYYTKYNSNCLQYGTEQVGEAQAECAGPKGTETRQNSRRRDAASRCRFPRTKDPSISYLRRGIGNHHRYFGYACQIPPSYKVKAVPGSPCRRLRLPHFLQYRIECRW